MEYSMKQSLLTAVCALGILSGSAFAKIEQSDSLSKISARFEHIAFNVSDPVAVAQWYVQHLGMKIQRQGGEPTFTTFVSDSGEHMMIEFFHNAQYPLFPAKEVDVLSFHLAFFSPDIEATSTQLLVAGATWADSIRITASGDKVCILRDPWGLPLQLVQRATSMLRFSGVYIEHVALNVKDSRVQSAWFTQHLNMNIVREGKAPSYGMFISDVTNSMMFELYQNEEHPVLDFATLSSMSLHIAFHVEDVTQAKRTLTLFGATVDDDVTTTPAGDEVLMLRSPWGVPLQFVHRAQPMLK